MIDASHDNSGKDPRASRCRPRPRSPTRSPRGNAAIVGVMLESFLVEGRQDLDDGEPLTYGQSITDACMDWEHDGRRCSTGWRRRSGRGAAG